jgi:hypothetical protein
MSVMRVGWVALAVVAVFLEIGAATSPMLQITNCEIGVYSRVVPNPEACHAPIRSYFGTAVWPVLAVPVIVSLTPVFVPRPRVARPATAALFVLSVAGFVALVFSSTPTLPDLFGFFWPVVFLAALVTGLAQVVNVRRDGPGRLQPAP